MDWKVVKKRKHHDVLYAFINPKPYYPVSAYKSSTSCLFDMRTSPSQQFAQHTRTAAPCQWVCGGAPAAWCWAKGSSRLMRVAPAATGLRFIYLGTKAVTQETQQDSNLTLEAADITGNIKLLCHISSLKMENGSPPFSCFHPDTFPCPYLSFCSFLGQTSAYLWCHCGKYILKASKSS